jgi:hypothetical protein
MHVTYNYELREEPPLEYPVPSVTRRIFRQAMSYRCVVIDVKLIKRSPFHSKVEIRIIKLRLTLPVKLKDSTED